MIQYLLLLVNLNMIIAFSFSDLFNGNSDKRKNSFLQSSFDLHMENHTFHIRTKKKNIKIDAEAKYLVINNACIHRIGNKGLYDIKYYDPQQILPKFIEIESNSVPDKNKITFTSSSQSNHSKREKKNIKPMMFINVEKPDQQMKYGCANIYHIYYAVGDILRTSCRVQDLVHRNYEIMNSDFLYLSAVTACKSSTTLQNYLSSFSGVSNRIIDYRNFSLPPNNKNQLPVTINKAVNGVKDVIKSTINDKDTTAYELCYDKIVIGPLKEYPVTDNNYTWIGQKFKAPIHTKDLRGCWLNNLNISDTEASPWLVEKIPRITLIKRRGTKRQILNEDYLIDAMIKEGWKVNTVDLEQKSLTEQFTLMQNSSTLIGYHGAGLSWARVTHVDAAEIQVIGLPCRFESHSTMQFKSNYAIIHADINAIEGFNHDQDYANQYCRNITHGIIKQGKMKDLKNIFENNTYHDIRDLNVIVNINEVITTIKRIDPTFK